MRRATDCGFFVGTARPGRHPSRCRVELYSQLCVLLVWRHGTAHDLDLWLEQACVCRVAGHALWQGQAASHCGGLLTEQMFVIWTLTIRTGLDYPFPLRDSDCNGSRRRHDHSSSAVENNDARCAGHGWSSLSSIARWLATMLHARLSSEDVAVKGGLDRL